MGYSRSAPSETGRVAEIISVDGEARMATGRTREGSDAVIDCRYRVGAMLVTPSVGEIWWIDRVGSTYTLRYRFPPGARDRLRVGREGQTQIGSEGPTEINGSVVNIHADLVIEDGAVVLGGTHYRDDGGTLQRRDPDTQEWLPVSSPSPVRFTAETATAAPTFSDRCYVSTRQLVGAYLRASSAPEGSDLVAEIQHSSAPGETWSTLATLTIADGTTTEDSATLSYDQVGGDYLRVEFTSVGSGTPAAGVVVDILVG